MEGARVLTKEQRKDAINRLDNIKVTLLMKKMFLKTIKVSELVKIVNEDVKETKDNIVREVINSTFDSYFNKYDASNDRNSIDRHIDSGEAKGASYVKRDGHYNGSNQATD